MPLPEHGKQVVDHAAQVGDVDLDVDVRGRVEREHDVIGARGILNEPGELQPVLREHALEQVLRSRFMERHLARRELVEHGGLPLDPDRPQPAIGERQRERQADPAEADYGDSLIHAKQSTCARRGTGAQTPGRSAG